MPELLQPWFADITGFLAMGRHGPFVWGSVAITALALVAEQLTLRAQGRRLASRAADGSDGP